MGRQVARRLATALMMTSVTALAFASPASARERADSSGFVDYNIPAQSLASALRIYAAQSEVDILYDADALAAVQAPEIRGRLQRSEALARLLSATGLSATLEAGAVRLEGAPRPQSELGPSEANSDPSDDAGAGDTSEDEAIVVTGTRIRGAHPAGSNLVSLDRQEMEATGRNSVQDVLQLLPQDFPGSQNETTQLGAASSGRNLAFASTVDLRGLGADATLTLVNGHRLAPAGFGNFVDISTIPFAAVDRVEVLADGASALYGSDAIAGVVNIILRDRFEGAETALRFGAATRGDPTEFAASQLWGTAWIDGDLMLGYEHRSRTDLASADRDFSASSDLTRYGGTDFSSTFANPANIIGIGDAEVQFAIPRGQDGTSLSQADLLDGVVNTRPFSEGNSLLPEQTSDALFMSLSQDLTSALRFNFDGFIGRRHANAERVQVDAFLVVPQTNAYRQLNNLFAGQGDLLMTYNLGADLGPQRFDTQTDAGALNAALIYDFANDWRVEGSIAYGRNDAHVALNNIFDESDAFYAALASSDLETAFNPFADGSNTNPALLDTLTYADLVDSTSAVTSYTLKADGPVFSVWGNQIRAAIGAEHRVEDFELIHERRAQTGSTFENYVPASSRMTDALFGELFIPLVGPQNDAPGVRHLDLSLSARYEHANDFGDATTPKIGLTWAPNEDIALRASWGLSFKAPQFQQLLGDVVGQFTIAPEVLDPFATDGSTGILLLAGPDPTLKPERGEHWTTGFDFTPHLFPEFSAHVTYFDIDFSERIDEPGNILAALAGAAGYAGVLIRNPSQDQIDQYLAIAGDTVGPIPPSPGIEAIWDGRLTNLASLRVRGIDASLAYERDTSFGQIALFANASVLLEYSRRTAISPSPIDERDTFFNPVDWRARAGISWAQGGWGAALAASYVDDYRDTISFPARTIESWTTWDVRLTRDWRTPEAPSGFAIALNIDNLFDEDPPFANNPIGYGFDAQAADPVGRFMSIELKRTW